MNEAEIKVVSISGSVVILLNLKLEFETVIQEALSKK